jgi:hypothetical protein
MNEFDIVILIGPKDIDFIDKQIVYTKKNVIGYRNIYLISCDEGLYIDGCITIKECIFPFSKETVIKYHGENRRNGWYFQQLLKLYAGRVIPDILETYLVIDCDTFFLKPTTFIQDNKCLYCYGCEYHKPYFFHMKKLHESLEKVDEEKSGICHHMIFEKKYVDELFRLVESKHNDLFYNIFLKCVDNSYILNSGASEYEIYFNYMLKYHNDKILIRNLSWKNAKKISGNYDYVSVHYYFRK